MKESEFREQYKLLIDHFCKKTSEEALKNYFRNVEKYSINSLKKAVFEIIRTFRINSFPTPQEIEDLCSRFEFNRYNLKRTICPHCKDIGFVSMYTKSGYSASFRCPFLGCIASNRWPDMAYASGKYNGEDFYKFDDYVEMELKKMPKSTLENVKKMLSGIIKTGQDSNIAKKTDNVSQRRNYAD